MSTLIHALFNLNQVLPQLVAQYGNLVYIGMFIVIFVETGLVVFPFLPGDSLLFLSGSIAAMTTHPLNPLILIVSLSIAAIVGDTVNFEIGSRFGQYLTESPRWRRFIKPKNIAEAQKFFEKHGSVAIFLGRFMPLIRTFIPFTAGISKMAYHKFILYNMLGGISWVVIAVLSGYFFGNIPVVQAHFELIMVSIIVISLLPAVIISLRKKKTTAVTAEVEEQDNQD
ncbi:MAG: VTT domain-containing protein [Lactobacillaceae bacterium]|jgi:membrane-associated protein|nr:VTT domain-containing protein [Lactobacillaceae bacterium]